MAERKVNSLLNCGARVLVVSPLITEGIKKFAEKGKIEIRQDNYKAGDLKGVFLAIGATDNDEVNRQVSRDCLERGLLVNVVDDPPHGNFYVPAVVRRGSLQIAISTDGKSPLLARMVRQRLEHVFPPEYGPLVELLGQLRAKVLSGQGSQDRKKDMMAKLLDQTTMELLWEGKFDLAKERIIDAYNSGGGQP